MADTNFKIYKRRFFGFLKAGTAAIGHLITPLITSPTDVLTIDSSLCITESKSLYVNSIKPKTGNTIVIDASLIVNGINVSANINIGNSLAIDVIEAKTGDTITIKGDLCLEDDLLVDIVTAKTGGTVIIDDDLCVTGTLAVDTLVPKTDKITIDSSLCVNGVLTSEGTFVINNIVIEGDAEFGGDVIIPGDLIINNIQGNTETFVTIDDSLCITQTLSVDTITSKSGGTLMLEGAVNVNGTFTISEPYFEQFILDLLNPGTAGYVLQSTGTNSLPVWVDPDPSNCILTSDMTMTAGTTDLLPIGPGLGGTRGMGQTRALPSGSNTGNISTCINILKPNAQNGQRLKGSDPSLADAFLVKSHVIAKEITMVPLKTVAYQLTALFKYDQIASTPSKIVLCTEDRLVFESDVNDMDPTANMGMDATLIVDDSGFIVVKVSQGSFMGTWEWCEETKVVCV